MGLRAQLHGALECRGRIRDPEGHGAYRRPVCLREPLPERTRLRIDHEVDVALRMQRGVLAAMSGNHREPQPLEQAAQQLRVGGGVFDEFESISTHRVRKTGVPGLSEIWAITGLRLEIDLVSIVTNGTFPETASREFLPYRLSVLSNTVSSAIAAAYFMNFGLTIPEWRVMAVLAANPGLSAAEVTARTAMDKVAVSRAVAALLSAGRLHRTTAPRRPAPHASRADARRHARLRTGRADGAANTNATWWRRSRHATCATLDRLVRVLLGRAVELGPAHAE